MGQLKVHTVDQPDSDITTFILSCNRLHLLEKTVDSYLRTVGVQTKTVILDDSGVPGVFEQLVAKYASELRAEGKKVFTLGYVDAKQLPANKKFLLNSEFFWREKLNGINLPIKGNIGQFLQLEFDLLLNLYQEPLLPMQAISAFSKAKYRVGSNVADNIDYNDAMIDTGNRNDLKYLIEQIDFYLRSIK